MGRGGEGYKFKHKCIACEERERVYKCVKFGCDCQTYMCWDHFRNWYVNRSWGMSGAICCKHTEYPQGMDRPFSEVEYNG